MPVTYGTQDEMTARGLRNESYAEFDEFTFQGKSYIFRVCALWPYKGSPTDPDALLCHIDFHNTTDGIKGRFANVEIPGRNPNENNGHLRRHSAMRKFKDLIRTETPGPSPIYP